MATPAASVQVYFANALLPAPLPTPPKSKMLPLLPTPCIVILPKSPPKPSRADAEERWDARKKQASPASAAAGQRSPGSKSSSPGRASSCARPDSKKNSNSRADSVERWDALKKLASPAPSSSSSAMSSNSATSRAASSERWDSNKRRPISRASPAAPWDAHKKPRPLQADGLDDDGGTSTGSNDMELDEPQPQPPRALYAGPGFVASPEPSMLPMPSFMVSAHCMVAY